MVSLTDLFQRDIKPIAFKLNIKLLALCLKYNPWSVNEHQYSQKKTAKKEIQRQWFYRQELCLRELVREIKARKKDLGYLGYRRICENHKDRVRQISEILGANSGLKYILNFVIDFYFLLVIVTSHQRSRVVFFFPLLYILHTMLCINHDFLTLIECGNSPATFSKFSEEFKLGPFSSCHY